MDKLLLTGRSLNFSNIRKIIDDIEKIEIILDEGQISEVEKSNKFLNEEIEKKKVIYGVNTGVGLLSNTLISADEQCELQKNIVMSHCTSPAPYLPFNESKLVLLLVINSLLKGYSGVSKELVFYLTELFNKNLIPPIPELGSAGASGDLAPLASIGLAIIGEGEIYENKEKIVKVKELKNFRPYTLKIKEGLSLVNGLHQSLAIFIQLFDSAKYSAALSLEGLRGSYQPFDNIVAFTRPNIGIYSIIDFYQKILKDSEINESHKFCGKVQDPYSFRCIPQVFGAIQQGIFYIEDIINDELLSCTDNPIVDYKNKKIIFGGNFHGQNLSFAGDFLALLISTLTNMSERRIEKLLDDTYTRLTPFLTRKQGLQSGLMIVQVVATELCIRNKTLATPVSVNTIPTSLGKEDFVSFSNLSVARIKEMLKNLSQALAIEAICATEALEFLKPLKPASALQSIYKWIRGLVAPLSDDRPLRNEILQLSRKIFEGELLKYSSSPLIENNELDERR
ncbi:MAG: histidine ammonia-lyase [Planctomycetota bacterium]